MDLLERALRAAAVPVRYTEGYNPHIRLSMGPALPLGAEALAEMFDVECHGDVEAGMLTRANRVLPEGLQLTACERLPEGSPSLGKAVGACRYRLRRLPGMPAWPDSRGGPGEASWLILVDVPLLWFHNCHRNDGHRVIKKRRPDPLDG